MKIEMFEKYPSETFSVASETEVKLPGGVTLVLADCTVTAVDKNGEDVSAVVLDQSTKAVVGEDNDQLSMWVRTGTKASSPYVIKYYMKASDDSIWVVKVKMHIVE